MLYDQMSEEQRYQLLQVLFRRFIVNVHGEMVDHELNSTFAFLRLVVESNGFSEMISKCSTWVRLGAFAEIDRLTTMSSGFFIC
jgi:hypothetical protein